MNLRAALALLATMLTATANGIASLTGYRLLLGVGESGAYPSGTKINMAWFPRSERAIAASIFDSGSRIGNALSLPLVAWIIGSFGWRMSFAVTGLIGFVWVAIWLIYYRDPEHHKSVTPEQVAALQAERGATPVGPKVSWSSLFGYRTIWGMMIGFFCLNFVIYFFITWFPTYLIQARGFSLTQLGTLGLLPGLVSIPCGWLGGFTSDALYRRGWRREDLPVGLVVTIDGHQARSGQSVANASSITLPDGKRLFAGAAPNEGGAPGK